MLIKKIFLGLMIGVMIGLSMLRSAMAAEPLNNEVSSVTGSFAGWLPLGYSGETITASTVDAMIPAAKHKIVYKANTQVDIYIVESTDPIVAYPIFEGGVWNLYAKSYTAQQIKYYKINSSSQLSYQGQTNVQANTPSRLVEFIGNNGGQSPFILYPNQYQVVTPYMSEIFFPTLYTDGFYYISREKLNQPIGYTSFFGIRLEGIKGLYATINTTDYPPIRWEKEFENDEFQLYNISDDLRRNKLILQDGENHVYLHVWNEIRWEAEQELDPIAIIDLPIMVVQTNADIPYIDPDTGEPGMELPQMPTAPDSSWDVIGWLRYIADWLIYIVKGIAYFVFRLGQAIGMIFSSASGLTSALSAILTFFPPEITSLIILAITVAIIARLFKR